MQLIPLSAVTPHASLSPLAEADRGPLAIAAADPLLWSHWPRDVKASGWDLQFDWMMGEQEAGRWMVHTVRLPDGRVAGQTCYLAIRPEHSGVEIGGTWYARDVQGSGVNPACKLMMLAHAFGCGAERVELKTDAMNARSRAAILKLGAQFEGIHRRHMRRPDGTWRDTAWYSVLRPEWPAVEAGLRARLDAAVPGEPCGP